jgi:hypothetical protein
LKIGVKIQGDKQLRAALLKLTRIQRTEANAVLQDALEPMKMLTEQNAMRHRQPFQPIGGHLDEGVVSVPVKENSSTTRTTWWVSFTGRARKIAHLLEFGTAPHAQPRRGIMHPGARPFPFFRPAFESTKDVTILRLASGIRRIIFSRIGR